MPLEDTAVNGRKPESSVDKGHAINDKGTKNK